MRMADLIAQASPPCHDCGAPIARVEMRWERTPGGEWVPTEPTMVCAKGHRVRVELFS